MSERAEIPCSLYRFYGRDDELLYVGITSVGPNRWAGHEAFQPWWPRVVRTTVAHYPDRALAREAERIAIIAEAPSFNVIHSGTHRKIGIRGENGSGTVNLRRDGRWHVGVRLDGHRYQSTVNSERAARLLLAAWLGANLPKPIRDRAIAILEHGPGAGVMPNPARKNGVG